MNQKASRVPRRTFIQAASSAALLPLAAGSAKAGGPNIILITADDLGWRDLGCYGSGNLRTPNLDALAEQGVRFTNAFVTAPSCSASRASIITGQAPHSVGVLGLTHVHPRYQMPARVPTMPRALKQKGYRTAIHGKWHVAAFRDTRSYGYDLRMSVMTIKRSGPAKRFISANRNHPFYLELNFMQTHRLPSGEFKMDPRFPVDPEAVELPDYWRLPDWPEIKKDAAKYYSQAEAMDGLIGDVMGRLEDEGLAENTLVLFVSDNGPPYPGCKTTCYDAGIGTPLIMRWPRGLPAGQVRDGLVSTADLAPTCLEAAGAGALPGCQGLSLLGMARGEVESVRDEVFAEVTYHVKYTPMRAIRTMKWKYIENLSPDPTGLDQNERFDWARRVAREPGQRCCVLRPPEELYDLARDPLEQNNLAEDPGRAGIKKDLKARLDKHRAETNDPFPNLR